MAGQRASDSLQGWSLSGRGWRALVSFAQYPRPRQGAGLVLSRSKSALLVLSAFTVLLWVAVVMERL